MRHKLGVIVPSWNTMMEYEMQRMAVLAIKGLGTQAHSTVKPEQVEALVTSSDRPDADDCF